MIDHSHKLERGFTLLIYGIIVGLKLKFHGNRHTGNGISPVGSNQNQGAAASFTKCENEHCVPALPFNLLAGASILKPH